jgi:hypothetical protein
MSEGKSSAEKSRSHSKSRKGKRDWDLLGVFKGKDKHGEMNYTSMYIWFIIAPIVIYFALYVTKPAFVTDTVNGVAVINNQKLFMWTLVGTILAWLLIYALYYCKF